MAFFGLNNSRMFVCPQIQRSVRISFFWWMFFAPLFADYAFNDFGKFIQAQLSLNCTFSQIIFLLNFGHFHSEELFDFYCVHCVNEQIKMNILHHTLNDTF